MEGCTPKLQHNSGSYGGMEAGTAVQLWERSIDKFGFRYTTLLSERDANQLCSKQVYGDTPIEKEECVNHVSKRLSTALCKLITETKKGAMTDAVFATFYHAISTDDDPQHDRCPAGAGSWCFFM